MKEWIKVSLWLLLAWFLIASHLWLAALIVAVIWWAVRQPPNEHSAQEARYTEGDLVGAGLVGYWWGNHK